MGLLSFVPQFSYSYVALLKPLLVLRVDGTTIAGDAPVVSHVSPGETWREMSTAKDLGTLASVAGNFFHGVQKDLAVFEIKQNPLMSILIR